MSLLEEVAKRVRPGSRGQAPVSQTSQNTRHDERRAPREGLSAPGANQTPEMVSWPIAMSNFTTAAGEGRDPGELPVDPDNPERFLPYESDNPAILRRLFGL